MTEDKQKLDMVTGEKQFNDLKAIGRRDENTHTLLRNASAH